MNSLPKRDPEESSEGVDQDQIETVPALRRPTDVPTPEQKVEAALRTQTRTTRHHPVEAPPQEEPAPQEPLAIRRSGRILRERSTYSFFLTDTDQEDVSECIENAAKVESGRRS
jgi:hypothetical protein